MIKGKCLFKGLKLTGRFGKPFAEGIPLEKTVKFISTLFINTYIKRLCENIINVRKLISKPLPLRMEAA